MENFLIVASESYMDKARALLASIFSYNKPKNVFLYLINVPPEKVENFREEVLRHRGMMDLNIRSIYKNLDSTKQKRAGKIEYTELMAFSANIRGKLIYDLLMHENIKDLLYIDADSLVVKNIGCIPKVYSVFDVTFMHRSTTEPFRFLSGIIYIKNNKNGKRFAKEYSEEIDNFGIFNWFSDQQALVKMYKKNIYSIGRLGKQYIDWRFTAKSKIWAGKGRSKKRREYIDAQIYYLTKFKTEKF